MTSKYDRLADHLTTHDGEEITLTFAEIEAIVGPLPRYARRAPSWWGVTPSGGRWFGHTFAWRQAGYVADRPDFAAETVTFRRVSRR